MLDFGAYLERIGLSASERPTLHDVYRAHATSIPFENLDPHRGIPVSLAQEDLERKLVRERRGGYCFEQNLLLASVLQTLADGTWSDVYAFPPQPVPRIAAGRAFRPAGVRARRRRSRAVIHPGARS